jgi:hypothetical protein
MTADASPPLPDGHERVLHCIVGVMSVARDPPNRADHAVLDRADDFLVLRQAIVPQNPFDPLAATL